MSITTTFGFMILSIAKLLRYSSNSKFLKSADYILALVAIISLLAISNYALQLLTSKNVLVFDSMAIHTALLFFLISFSISLKYPDYSFVGFLIGKYSGSKQARRLLPFIVLLPIILSAVLLYAFNLVLLNTSLGLALYTICYTLISILYFSLIFKKLNNSDEVRTNLEAALQIVNQTLNQYKLALDKSSILAITDNLGFINYVNDKFTEVSGFTQEEAIGQPFKIVNSGHHSAIFFEDLWATILQGEVWIGGIKNKSKTGEFFWIHTVIVPILNTKGQVEQFLTIGQDITHLTILSNQYKNLKLKNKEIEQFTYLASHDLQEPLKTLKSMSNLLQMEYGDKLNDGAKKSLDYISAAATRMGDLIKALLDYSLIGKHHQVEAINTNTIESVLLDLSILIDESGAKVTSENSPILKAYKTEFRLLFQNLIQNAIKFKSQERPSEIFISSKNDGEFYTFCVKDNGIGIPNEQLMNIFGLFKRLHKKSVFNGTGIGLAHCEKIINLHGGIIWATSELNKGTSIYFTIPLL